MPPKNARGKSPGRKPKPAALPGTHPDDGQPTVVVSTEVVDDMWAFFGTLAVSLAVIARSDGTWNKFAWLNFTLSVVTQVLFAHCMKVQKSPFLTGYSWVSCATLVVFFSDCAAERPWADLAHGILPIQPLGSDWCGTEKKLRCIVDTYTTVRNTGMGVAWWAMWCVLPLLTKVAQRCAFRS
jgi:hypothetical protein